jgi:hypothetical protein
MIFLFKEGIYKNKIIALILTLIIVERHSISCVLADLGVVMLQNLPTKCLLHPTIDMIDSTFKNYTNKNYFIAG